MAKSKQPLTASELCGFNVLRKYIRPRQSIKVGKYRADSAENLRSSARRPRIAYVRPLRFISLVYQFRIERRQKSNTACSWAFNVALSKVSCSNGNSGRVCSWKLGNPKIPRRVATALPRTSSTLVLTLYGTLWALFIAARTVSAAGSSNCSSTHLRSARFSVPIVHMLAWPWNHCVRYPPLYWEVHGVGLHSIGGYITIARALDTILSRTFCNSGVGSMKYIPKSP